MSEQDETHQQNLVNPGIGKGNALGNKRTQFKPGYDPRRWLSGRGKKSPEQREGERILRAVIWEELSREFDAITGKPTGEQPETVDALRLMVRQQIKKDWRSIQDRIAGKLTDRVDVTSGGKEIKGYAIVSPDDWKKDDGK